MSIVAVGTSEAPVAFQADNQVHSRFTPFDLPRWVDGQEYRRLLVSFESVLPLRNPSELQQRPMAQFLMAASGGLLGEVSKLLTAAAEAAVLNGTERITLPLLEQAADVRR